MWHVAGGWGPFMAHSLELTGQAGFRDTRGPTACQPGRALHHPKHTSLLNKAPALHISAIVLINSVFCKIHHNTFQNEIISPSWCVLAHTKTNMYMTWTPWHSDHPLILVKMKMGESKLADAQHTSSASVVLSWMCGFELHWVWSSCIYLGDLFELHCIELNWIAWTGLELVDMHGLHWVAFDQMLL